MHGRGPHFCPNCGERVSAFAAGCSICGAELDPQRAMHPPGLAQRARRLLSGAPRPRRRRPAA